MQADVSLSLVCSVAASCGSVTWAHAVALAWLLAVQPIESKRALWDDRESRNTVKIIYSKAALLKAILEGTLRKKGWLKICFKLWKLHLIFVCVKYFFFFFFFEYVLSFLLMSNYRTQWRVLVKYFVDINHLIPPVIVTVKKVFLCKALRKITDWRFSTFPANMEINKGSQLNMCSVKWIVHIATWPEPFTSCLHHEKMMAASKLQNKRLVK